MNRPKVLVFIDWFLPGYKAGGPITSMRHMISHLHQEVDFYVVTRNTDYQSNEPYDAPCNKWIHLETYHCYYLKDSDLSKDSLRTVIDSHEFDMFYINGMYSKFFSILPLDLLKADKRPKVVAPRGMLTPSAMAIKPLKKKVFLTLARLSGKYKDVVFHATNEKEKSHVLNQFSKARVLVAPNLGPGLTPRENCSKSKGVLKLIFLGRTAPEKNTLLAIQSLKNIHEGRLELDIVGEVYDRSYHQLCLKEIEGLPENVKVSFKGSIPPDSISNTLQSHHYLFLPTKGENFGHAILESFMCGVPVVISDQTPWSYCQDEGVAFVQKNESNLIEATLRNLMSQNQADYEQICGKVNVFAQNYVKNSAAIEQTKTLFKLN